MIIELNEESEEWNNFLNENQHYIFHRPEYFDFIKETFPNTRPQYFAVKEDKIRSIFPFFHITQPSLRSLMSKLFSIFQPKIISAAFNDYGGPCGDINKEDMVRILDSIKKNVPYIEIRQGLKKFEKELNHLPSKKYKRFVLELNDIDNVWKGIQKAKRKAIKKSEKTGTIVKDVPISDLNKLYKLYLKNMKSFGELPLPKKYFSNFYKHFIYKELGKCLGSYHNGKLISVLLGYCCSERVHIIIAVSDNRYLNLRPNDAVHWSMIEWACNSGYKYFDFGHTREESGQFEYKRKWGGTLKDLNRYYVLGRAKEMPSVDPTNPKYQLYIKLWKILPLWITRSIGPWLREGLGI